MRFAPNRFLPKRYKEGTMEIVLYTEGQMKSLLDHLGIENHPSPSEWPYLNPRTNTWMEVWVVRDDAGNYRYHL